MGRMRYIPRSLVYLAHVLKCLAVMLQAAGSISSRTAMARTAAGVRATRSNAICTASVAALYAAEDPVTLL